VGYWKQRKIEEMELEERLCTVCLDRLRTRTCPRCGELTICDWCCDNGWPEWCWDCANPRDAARDA
jgi:hypothetical protein